LYIALSLFLPYFVGLGFLVHSVSPRSLRNTPKSYPEVSRYLAFNILLGISLNHLIVLFSHDLKISLIIGATLSVIGFSCAIVVTRKDFYYFFNLGAINGVLALVTSLFFLLCILNSPLGWDAQYIWFFHGKMIYFSNGLYQTAGWSNPAYQFSHVDYPKLIAILSAQFAYVIGYWDDYLPRLSLLVLLVPAILGVTSFFIRCNISFIYLYLMVFFSLNVYTINGYMDAYLAIYACISLLFLGRGITSDNSDDILAGFAFVSIIPLIKNEGMLFLVSIIVSILLLLAVCKNKRHLLMLTLRFKVSCCLSALLLSNIVLWSWIKYKWGLKNDLNLGISSIRLIMNRLSDGSITIITKYILSNTNIGISIFILLLTIVFSYKYDVFDLNKIILCISVTTIYFTGIFLTYMATPYDLLWHVSSSIDRTMMTVNLSIIAANFVVLTTLDFPYRVSTKKTNST